MLFRSVSLSGTDANNYSVNATGNNSTASITRLPQVSWTGGATGNWFDPANWAGGAVPDLANVASVVIPAGVTVSFGTTVVSPAEAGAVSLDALGTAGSLSMTGGTLNVGVVADPFNWDLTYTGISNPNQFGTQNTSVGTSAAARAALLGFLRGVGMERLLSGCTHFLTPEAFCTASPSSLASAASRSVRRAAAMTR